MFYQERVFLDFIDKIILKIPSVHRVKRILIEIFHHLELSEDLICKLRGLNYYMDSSKSISKENPKELVRKINPTLIAKTKHFEKFSTSNHNENSNTILNQRELKNQDIYVPPTKIHNYFRKLDKPNIDSNKHIEALPNCQESFLDLNSLKAHENLEIDFFKRTKKNLTSNYDQGSGSVLQEILMNPEHDENIRIANTLFEPNNSNFSSIVQTIKSTSQMNGCNHLGFTPNSKNTIDFSQFTFGGNNNNSLELNSQKENNVLLKNISNTDLSILNEDSRFSLEEKAHTKMNEHVVSATKSTGYSNYSHVNFSNKRLFLSNNEDSNTSIFQLKGINTRLTDINRIPKANKIKPIKKSKKKDMIPSTLSTILENFGIRKGKTTDEIQEVKKPNILAEEHPLKKIGRNFYANRVIKTPSPEIDSKRFSKKLLDNADRGQEKFGNTFNLLASKGNKQKINSKKIIKNGIDFDKISPEKCENTEEEVLAYSTPTKDFCVFGKMMKNGNNKKNVLDLYGSFQNK